MAATVMELYGSKVFNEHEMRERLPSSTYKSLKATILTELLFLCGIITQISRTFYKTKGTANRICVRSALAVYVLIIRAKRKKSNWQK